MSLQRTLPNTSTSKNVAVFEFKKNRANPAGRNAVKDIVPPVDGITAKLSKTV